MKTAGIKHHFVEWGGWVKQTQLGKPKTRLIWAVTAAWFAAFGAVFSSVEQVSYAWWNVAWVGEVALIVSAAVMSNIEKPIALTQLVRNPDKKPECLY